jgi:hypothetical protein
LTWDQSQSGGLPQTAFDGISPAAFEDDYFLLMSAQLAGDRSPTGSRADDDRIERLLYPSIHDSPPESKNQGYFFFDARIIVLFLMIQIKDHAPFAP